MVSSTNFIPLRRVKTSLKPIYIFWSCCKTLRLKECVSTIGVGDSKEELLPSAEGVFFGFFFILKRTLSTGAHAIRYAVRYAPHRSLYRSPNARCIARSSAAVSRASSPIQPHAHSRPIRRSLPNIVQNDPSPKSSIRENIVNFWICYMGRFWEWLYKWVSIKFQMRIHL